jgi:4'-phosphopantetheinyl transferase
MMVYVLYSYFRKQFEKDVFDKYLSMLPLDQKQKNHCFVRWQDKHLHLLGRLLLIEGFRYFGFECNEMNKIEYNQYGKPFINKSDIDFNISHSGNFAICAISVNSKVGIDIEEIRPIELTDFKENLTEREWFEIQLSENPLNQFYYFWTRKESVIKADGRGLSLPLEHIDTLKDSVKFEGEYWFLKTLKVHNEYSVCLAIDKKDIEIKQSLINF